MSEFLQLAIKYLPELFKAALLYTIPLAFISFIFGVIIATITALIQVSKLPKKLIPKILLQVLKIWTTFYVWLFRSIPMLVQLFIVFYGLPSAGIDIFANPWVSAITVFSFNTGAYASQNIRAAIISVSSGQKEAAQSQGLSSFQTYWNIILPQASRIAVPPLSNTIISLVKDTSLASSITIVEAFYTSQQIAAENYKVLQMYILVAIVYAVFTTILTFIQSKIEKRLSVFKKN
jgi:cystine transport system permease protein